MSTEKSAASVKPPKPPTKTPAATGPAQRPGNGPADRAKKYLGEVMTELRKTTWPTRPELIAQTQVVLGMLIAVGIFIYLWDTLLGQIFKMILRLLRVQQ